MGLIRKTMSVSTLGGVKYTSRREAETKAAAAQARAAREEAKLLKAQRRAVRAPARPAAQPKPRLERQPEPEAEQQVPDQRQAVQESFQWDDILAAFEAGEMTWGDLTRTQKAKMPFGYQMKCRRAASQRRKAAG